MPQERDALGQFDNELLTALRSPEKQAAIDSAAMEVDQVVAEIEISNQVGAAELDEPASM